MAATLTVITGPMFSGKSKELIRTLEVIEIAKRSIVVIKPKVDTRTNQEIAARTKKCDKQFEKLSTFPAHSVSSAAEVYDLLEQNKCDVLAMDEAQFFEDWAVELVNDLLEEKRATDFKIIVAGLDMDHQKKPFGPMPKLMAIADEVIKLKAVCEICRQLPENAIFTKKVGGSTEQVEIGDKDIYQARCRACH
ncbi:MAG: thymidine kinase [Candidatus Paceibacterota bacterium]